MLRLLTPVEEAGLKDHGLDIGTPSQLSDVFRQGVAWGQKSEREACAKLCDNLYTGKMHDYALGYDEAVDDCATAIRDQGEQK